MEEKVWDSLKTTTMEKYADIKCHMWHSQHTHTQYYLKHPPATASRSVPFDFFDLSYTSAPPVNNTMSGYVQKEGGAKKSAGQRAEGVTQKPHDRNALWVISNTHKRWLIWAPVDSHIYLYSIIRRGVGGIQWQRAGLHDRTVHEDIVYVCVCFDKAAPELQRELLSFATCSSKNTEI